MAISRAPVAMVLVASITAETIVTMVSSNPFTPPHSALDIAGLALERDSPCQVVVLSRGNGFLHLLDGDAKYLRRVHLLR